MCLEINYLLIILCWTHSCGWGGGSLVFCCCLRTWKNCSISQCHHVNAEPASNNLCPSQFFNVPSPGRMLMLKFKGSSTGRGTKAVYFCSHLKSTAEFLLNSTGMLNDQPHKQPSWRASSAGMVSWKGTKSKQVHDTIELCLVKRINVEASFIRKTTKVLLLRGGGEKRILLANKWIVSLPFNPRDLLESCKFI